MDGDSAVIFSDDSWQFIRNIPNITEFFPPKKDFKKLDSTWCFSFNWDINRTHRNVINLSGMKDTFKVSIFPYDNGFSMPILTGNVSSKFDWRWGQMHKGIDFAAPIGTPIYATFSGKIRYAKMNSGGYGNLIIIRHYNGLETYYAHLNTMVVESNQYVRAGQIIGYCGNTGHSTGPHLHFEVRFIENAINPEIIFDVLKNDFKTDMVLIRKSLFDYQKKKASVSVNEIVPGGTSTGEKDGVGGEIKKPNDGKKRRNPIGFYGDM